MKGALVEGGTGCVMYRFLLHDGTYTWLETSMQLTNTGQNFLFVARDYRLTLAEKSVPTPLCGFKNTLLQQLAVFNTGAAAQKAITIHTAQQCVLQLLMTGSALIVTRMSGDTLRILQCSPAQLAGKSLVDFVHCEDKVLLSAIVQRLRHDDCVVRSLFRFISPQRTIIWLEVSIHRVGNGSLDIVMNPATSDTEEEEDEELFGPIECHQ